MALAHTILTLLLENPASGYDISKHFEDGVNCYWNASQQQIYREMTKLEKQGLVERQVVPQEGKPDKKIYSITAAGHSKIVAWCNEPTDPTVIREDLMVRILATPIVEPQVTLTELQRRKQVHVRNLAHLTGKKDFYLEHGSFCDGKPGKLDKYRYLTLLRGIRYEQSWVDWCEEVEAMLRDDFEGDQISLPSETLV